MYPQGGFVNALENPGAVNALAASLDEVPDAKKNIPLIPMPFTDGRVRLPGGLMTQEGTVLLDAEVRELTGVHEEAITRAQTSGKFSRFVGALLRSGVVSIGDKLPDELVLRSLLVGDRDALILGIRRATYGDHLELAGVVCPHCRDQMDLTITLDDFPERRLENPLARTWDVPMRKGGYATVRLPTGGDQDTVFDDAKLSTSQQNTLLLSRCVISITAPNGDQVMVTGIDHAQNLGLVDRKSIMDKLDKEQPGPRYDQLDHVCEACGKGFPISVTVGDLFFS